MKRLPLALLLGASICLALIVALFVWRAGGGAAGATAGLAAGLAVPLSIYGLFRGRGAGSVNAEVDALRQAHAGLAGRLDEINQNLELLAEAIQDKAVRRSEELAYEVRMLEDLVQRMGSRIDERLAGTSGAAAAAVTSSGLRPGERESVSPGRLLLDSVREALAENRVDLYLQPVVGLPQRRTVFYESYSRLRDATGRVIMPAEFLSVAEPEGLVTAIDNLLLFRCVQIVRRLAKQDRKVAIFCNISLSSLADDGFFPQFLEFLSENKDMASALVFELGQAAFEQRGAVEARNMGKLAELGFRFSIDKVADLDIDFRELQRADVKFVKVAADLLMDQLVDVDGRPALKSLKDLHASDFAPLARRYGAEIIAEKVETERQVIDILELDIGYGQGNLFGEPRAIRDAVLAEAAPPSSFVNGVLRRVAAR
jgi:cyclic-di-GMP phosphodiesterase TipF (flagellum assembly factor)